MTHGIQEYWQECKHSSLEFSHLFSAEGILLAIMLELIKKNLVSFTGVRLGPSETICRVPGKAVRNFLGSDSFANTVQP